jgi:hypothetical protein
MKMRLSVVSDDQRFEFPLDSGIALLQRECDWYRETLEEITHLVRHEWRAKDHSPSLVLGAIEDVLSRPENERG